jgi:outer membrane protein TolC
MGMDVRRLLIVIVAVTPSLRAADPPPQAYGLSTSSETAKTLPIDLATTLRLADANNPLIAIAQARYREALARQDQAELLFLPTLATGATYFRLDGNTQNQAGLVFTVSRSNLFAGGLASLRVDTADAYFQPLIARRAARAESLIAKAANIAVSYDAASGYLDLLQAHAAAAVVTETLARANQMLDRAESAVAAGLSKTSGDANRARVEVNLRNQELLEMRGRAGVASARLTRLLTLEPAVELLPADIAAVPMTLVPFERTIDELILTAWTCRPEMAAQQALIGAAQERLRAARYGPLLPKVQLEYTGGTFGGGRNDFVGQFDGRGDLVASAFWELKNLGLGNRAQARERQAQLDQASHAERAIRASVAGEVSEAARLAATRIASLDAAQTAVRESQELYRKLLESSFGMANPQPKYDALEPLLAIQALHQARMQYLTQVIEFNRAQFRLFTAMGQPADCAVPAAP